ncbi:MAG: hypothetical protein PHD10_04330 [Bacilli bacterium]|nr:hypothetical protein [Bacilli bacterium]MDD4608336.1 hypothetical protein [Bacilli bacterium]
MDENLELLEYVYQNAEMGVFTLTKLINILNDKENKIKKVVEEQLKGYEKYLKESKKLLKDSDCKAKSNDMMSKFQASMGISMETMKDNSDASIAHMLMQGITMGIVDITSKIDNYQEEADKKNINLAKDYLKFQEEQQEILKPYL